MKRVFIFLRGGILVRNFANDELIYRLEHSGMEFVLFSPEPEHPVIKTLFAAQCFKVHKIGGGRLYKSRMASFFADFLIQIRRFTYGNSKIDENGCNVSLIEALKSEQIATSGKLGRLFYYLILFIADLSGHYKPLRIGLNWIEKKLFPYSAHKYYYDKYQPKLTIVTSLGFGDDALYMREAHAQNVKTLVLVKNWDVPTTRGIGGVIPDHVFVWNDIMKNEVVKYHDIEERRIEICGISQWDSYFSDIEIGSKEEFLNKYGLSNERKTVYFAMTTPSHYFHNVKLSKLILKLIDEEEDTLPCQLLIRLHPAYVLINGMLTDEVKDEINIIKEKYGNRVAFSYPHSETYCNFSVPSSKNDIDLKEILLYSDALITVYSTQILEGLIFDIPIINAGLYNFRGTRLPVTTYEGWDHIMQVMDREAVSYCYNEEQLKESLFQELKMPSKNSNKRVKLAEKIIIPELRGRGGVETAKLLSNIMNANG